ncbi:MAG TPA: hypothetical protein VGR91_16795 [Stellaceae bacterium]|nr:hypothetical protein [Stellaceae bacterium]
MGPQTNILIAIIVVVTVALFLVGLVWRLYNGELYRVDRGGYDVDLE